jgi:hypothetical protein
MRDRTAFQINASFDSLEALKFTAESFPLGLYLGGCRFEPINRVGSGAAEAVAKS